MPKAFGFAYDRMIGRCDRGFGPPRGALASAQSGKPGLARAVMTRSSTGGSTMSKLCLMALLLTALEPAYAADAPETERSVEGVRAVEAHWQKAFLSGDGAYLESL